MHKLAFWTLTLGNSWEMGRNWSSKESVKITAWKGSSASSFSLLAFFCFGGILFDKRKKSEKLLSSRKTQRGTTTQKKKKKSDCYYTSLTPLIWIYQIIEDNCNKEKQENKSKFINFLYNKNEGKNQQSKIGHFIHDQLRIHCVTYDRTAHINW